MYDGNGNILSKETFAYTTGSVTSGIGTVQSYFYNNRDQLQSYNGQTFAYDAVGNPTTYKGQALTWNRGRKLVNFNGTTFTYDAQGKRIRKNSTAYYYNSAEQLLKSSDGMEYFYGSNGVMGFVYSGNKYIYCKNLQGDVIEILDSSGNSVVQYVYDAWGNCTVSTTSNQTLAQINPFRYRGYFYDVETGLYFLKTRYYDPTIGRFINMDSINYVDPESINGLNLYAYCYNDPINYLDEEGKAPKWLGNLLIGISIVVGTALFAAAIIASAGAVGALVGVGAAAVGLSASAVATAVTVATVSTYVVAGGVALFGASDAIEAFSGGINPIRDYIMAGNQTAYDITSGVFNALGTIATIAGSVGPKVLQKIAQKGGIPKISNGQTVGFSRDFFDRKGNWNLRIDATTHGHPNGAKWHHNPHYHVGDRGGEGSAVYYLWEWIKEWFNKIK